MKEAKMKALHVLIAICFSASAFAQDASPKVGGKPLVQVKPKTPQLQTCRNGQGDQAVGRRLHSVRTERRRR
jgi:hypothetical protein